MNELNLAFAFSAGLVATINPCGWAMLPSFVSYYLGSKEEGFESRAISQRLGEGLVLGLLVVAGFLVVFGGVGALISIGLRAIIRWMPLAAIGVGVALVLLGLWLLGGKNFPVALPAFNLNLNARNPRSVFLFGMAYAFASLSCTLPIFLAVIGAGLATSGPWASAAMLLSYGAGMALVLIAVALSAALLKDSVVKSFSRLLPYVHNFGAAMLILAGLYLIGDQSRYIGFFKFGL